MTSNQIIALILLVGRMITIGFILSVMAYQFRLIRLNKYPEYQGYRLRLFFWTSMMMIGNFIPIVIDVMGIFKKGSFGVLLAYVFSNNLTALMSAVLAWALYSKANREP